MVAVGDREEEDKLFRQFRSYMCLSRYLDLRLDSRVALNHTSVSQEPTFAAEIRLKYGRNMGAKAFH